jgi:uncharacterized surface protein with fasciclin (FAS1) repeats
MAKILETAKQSGSFQTLMQAIEAVNLSETLNGEQILTLLAPTDDAFASLEAGTLDELLQDAPKLKRILMYHVISGDVRSDDLAQIDEAPTLEGSVVAVEHDNGVRVNDAKVLQTDLLADNGVIHTIDRVLMPALISGHS